MNDLLILTLLNIPKVSRKIINNLIKNREVISTNSMESIDIKNIFLKGRIVNTKISIPTIEEIDIAKAKAEEVLCNSIENGINNITILDDCFPQKLKKIEDPPVILFYKGNKSCIYANKSVAIIGTRKPTSHGEKIAERLGYLFGKDGYVVISGLAKGCDEFGHKGCVSVSARSIAVLPGGLDHIYPASNKDLARMILENDGCLISEYSIGTKPFKSQFVERDRLQSALSEAVIVVETDVKGGTMHTVEYALNQNKIVACYKHSMKYLDNNQTHGNIKLIEEGKAFSISSPKDIEELKIKIAKRNELDSKEEGKVESAIQIGIDEISFELEEQLTKEWI